MFYQALIASLARLSLLAMLIGLMLPPAQPACASAASMFVFSEAASQADSVAVINAADYPSLQDALDAVPEGGGVVNLPPETFEITEPLVLKTSDTYIRGSGTATHVVNRNRNGRPALIIRHPDYPRDGKNQAPRLWRIQLADFRISGNPESGDGILAQGINEIYLHGMAVDHHGGNGITLVDCYEDPRIVDSIITYNKKTGLHILRGHDIVVNGNQFEENRDGVRCIDSFNLTMSGNNLDDHLRHGVVIENTYGSVLSGNMIEECQGTAIILDRDCYGITLSANVIAHDFGGGIDLRDAWGCAVSSNTFTIVPEFSIRVGSESGRITITGNNFSNSYIGDRLRREQPSPATGVLLQNTSDVAITGNVFTGMARGAVQAEGENQHILVQSNVMTDLSRSESGRYPAVDLDGNAGKVQNNSIHP